MIVVIGSPLARSTAGRVAAAGQSSEIAVAIAMVDPGLPVQLVGRIGDDQIADAVLGDLSRRGVSHVAMLRDAAHPTPLVVESSDPGDGDRQGLGLDAQDVALALRYLTDISVLIVTPGLSSAVLAVAADAASWSGSAIILAGPWGTTGADVAIAAAIDIEPAHDEAGTAFAARVAAMAVREALLRSAR